MKTRGRVDQLHDDPDLVARAGDTAFEVFFNAEALAHLA